MISYGTVGSNDLDKAIPFYDELLQVAGMKRLMEHPSGGRLYAGADGRMFGVLAPFDGERATVGNGSMHGFRLESPEQVRAFHESALKLGGSCEGAPGLRGPEEMQAYFTYIRDLDGNKLCAFHFGVQ